MMSDRRKIYLEYSQYEVYPLLSKDNVKINRIFNALAYFHIVLKFPQIPQFITKTGGFFPNNSFKENLALENMTIITL